MVDDDVCMFITLHLCATTKLGTRAARLSRKERAHHEFNTLHTEPVRQLLDRLFAAAEQNDGPILARVHSEMDKTKLPHLDSRQQELLKDAYIPVGPETGRLLYQMARARPARLIVEFGLSFGLSTIYLAAAVKDNGMGRVITTEVGAHQNQAGKREFAGSQVARIMSRSGKATRPRPWRRSKAKLISFSSTDGRNLYLPVAQAHRTNVSRPGRLVVADDLNIMPEALKPYLKHGPQYQTMATCRLNSLSGDGLELSQWTR